MDRPLNRTEAIKILQEVFPYPIKTEYINWFNVFAFLLLFILFSVGPFILGYGLDYLMLYLFPGYFYGLISFLSVFATACLLSYYFVFIITFFQQLFVKEFEYNPNFTTLVMNKVSWKTIFMQEPKYIACSIPIDKSINILRSYYDKTQVLTYKETLALARLLDQDNDPTAGTLALCSRETIKEVVK